MAINKVVNKSTKSHGAMRNVLEYVLRNEKVKEGYVEIAGPYYGETINYNEVYKSWLTEKKLWDKDSGRMYTHNIISFHKDEQVSPEQVLEIGKEFAEKFFNGHQYVVAVHQDKEHLHCHIVTNTVSYLDGMKLHQTKQDLEHQKKFTNNYCLSIGLTIAEKGHHFDGSVIEQGEISAWNKDKYNLISNASKKSFVAECAIALLETVAKSTSKEDFISGMNNRGWSVLWEDTRKHIVFENEDGKKVRDTNIEKTFAGLKVNKEALLDEFKRQNELRVIISKSDEDGEGIESKLKQYYAELDYAAEGLDIAKAIRYDSEAITRDTETYQYYTGYPVSFRSDYSRIETSEKTGTNTRFQKDSEAFIRELDTKEEASGKKRDHCIAKRKNRDAEQRRLSFEGERAIKAEQQRTIGESGEGTKRSCGHNFRL